MKTIAILTQKGGAGKTTLALHLAVAAETHGLDVAVLDLDPQASAAAWKDSRPAPAPAVTSVQASRLAHALEIARSAGADLAVLDTGAGNADVAMAAAEAADLILIPCRDGIFDLKAIMMTARIVRMTAKPAFVVFNATPVGAHRIIEDAAFGVGQLGLEVAPITIHQRAAYKHALTDGMTAQEYEPGGKADLEMASLFAWLAGKLALQHKEAAQ